MNVLIINPLENKTKNNEPKQNSTKFSFASNHFGDITIQSISYLSWTLTNRFSSASPHLNILQLLTIAKDAVTGRIMHSYMKGQGATKIINPLYKLR